MLRIGDKEITAAYLGGQKIVKAYLGEKVVFDTVEPPVPVYTVTPAIDPAGSGTATGAGTYQQGASVTVTASPADGYKFVGWKNGGTTVSTSVSYTFTVTGDTSLTAVFEAEQTSRLPAGYTEVEYIQGGPSTNANYMPYIQMVAHSTATKLEFTFRDPNSVAIQSATVPYYGYDISPNSNNQTRTYFLIGLKATLEGSNYVPYVTVNYGNNSARRYTVQAVANTKYTVVLDSVAKTIVVNGSSFSGPSSTYWRNAKNTLFRWVATANGISPTYRKDVCIYELKMWDANGALVCDMVPCINPSGTVGFYDTIGQRMYSNANTSTNANNYFTAGPAV